MARTELEAALLRGLVAGVTWTAERAARHRLRDGTGSPHCSAPEEHEDHALLTCPEWRLARGPWIPWVELSAQVLPRLGAPATWSPCLQRAGLLPIALTKDAAREDAFEFARRLYGMFLALLAALFPADGDHWSAEISGNLCKS